jgi:hypothetical protein
LALRSDTPTTVAPASASRTEMADPFGDGSTRRSMPPARRSAFRMLSGDRVIWPGPACLRSTASIAPCRRATSTAESSRQRYGSTRMPCSTATVRVVVKDSTSTTATKAAPDATTSAPTGPQSKRTR